MDEDMSMQYIQSLQLPDVLSPKNVVVLRQAHVKLLTTLKLEKFSICWWVSVWILLCTYARPEKRPLKHSG